MFGAGAVDVSGEALLAEIGQIPAVIDVRVGKHHAVDGAWLERKMSVSLKRLGAPPLIESAIQEDALSIDLDQVLRSGCRSRRSAKGNLHVCGWISMRQQ